MYLDDWLLHAPSKPLLLRSLDRTLTVCQQMGFLFNFLKSHLTPSQALDWLGLTWNTQSSSVSLSPANATRLRRKLHLALVSHSYSRSLWDSLVSSLSFATDVVPLGHLAVRRLCL